MLKTDSIGLKTGRYEMREIQRISITDMVVDSIREMIETEEYKVGEKLPVEAELCRMLGVSRTSVREAIRVLRAQGYIESKPGRGAYVAAKRRMEETPWYDVENPQFTDFMEVRMAMETMAVRLAVERAREKDINKLEEIHQSFLEANEKKEMTRLIMLDELYHTTIFAITKNQLLINVNAQLLEAFRQYRSESFMNENVYQNAIEPHRILECFRRHDAGQAVEEMRKHLDITTSDMERIHKKQM